MSQFQSYLIVGNKNLSRQETETLAKALGINLNKPSVDIYLISPQKPHLSIDQIRQLKKHIFQKPISSPFKFVIIEKAQLLTDEAQNALLKILEEPPRQAIIVLEAEDEKKLLPTIRSRVLIKHIFDHQQIATSDSSILDVKDTIALLEKISDITNPQEWLNNQILQVHEALLIALKSPKPQNSPKYLAEIIEKCASTKEMIEANVNPRFALANLIFSLHQSALI